MGEIAALANAVVWALTGVVTKGLGKKVSPIQIVAFQSWIALALFGLIGLLFSQVDELFRAPLRSVLLLAAGAFINTIGSIIFWMAIARGKVSSVYPTTQSVFILVSMLAAWLLLGDTPRAGVVFGAALIIGGVLLLNRQAPDGKFGKRQQNDYIAISLAVATSLLWAGGFITTVVGLEDTRPLPAAMIRILVPSALFLVLSMLVPSTRINRVFKGNEIRLTVSALLFAFSALSFVFALGNASPGVVVLLINTSPMFAVIFAVIALGERLTLHVILGSVCSLLGIFAVLAFR